MSPVRVVTWNVNSLKARLPRVLELLAEHRPDIACLQETKAPADAFPALELDAAGYECVHNSAGQWSGVAILARRELELRDPVLGLEGDALSAEARWCEATVDGLRVASVYVPNGRSPLHPEYARKLRFLDAMAARVERLHAIGPLLIGGDMNIAPADLDVYDPPSFAGSTHVTPEERRRLQGMLGLGLVDAYRHLHPSEVQYTWWDYRAGHFHKGLGLRIDLLLLSRELAGRLRSCGIARDYRKGSKPSDHAPLLAELDSS